MYNELLTIGNFTIHGYGLMIGIGIIAAYLMTEHLAKRKGFDAEPVFSLLIFGVIGGILGAKLLYYITVIDEIIADPSILLNVTDGFVVYGGIIGGIAAGYGVCRVKKLNFFGYLDCATPSIALAQGFGRIGCLLAGCCYGMETTCPIAITFTNSQFAPNNIPLIPTQIYSSIFDFLLFALLYRISRRSKIHGQTSGLYLIFYGVGRFIIEFFRGDMIRGSVGSLSTSQFISIFIVVFGILLVFFTSRRARQNAVCEAEKAGAQETESETEKTEDA